MVVLLFLGLWVALGPSVLSGRRTNPDAKPFSFVIGDKKFQAERLSSADPATGTGSPLNSSMPRSRAS
jgi:hypothetical protein